MENDHENEHNASTIYLLGRTYLTKNEKFYIRNDPIIHMAAGDRHTIIVTESGRTYSFGDNNSGQLGLGHMNYTEKVSYIKSLKFVNTGEKVILAACGHDSSLVATNQGSLYAFGSNNHCQLGIESKESTTVYPYPVKIEYFHSTMSWKQISMGAKHTCVLDNNGVVYVWGLNEDGQCGQARKHNIIRIPTKLRLEYSTIAISCGYYHTALITEGGRVFLFGNNSDKQLGCSIPTQYVGPFEVSLPDPVIAIACGNQHTVVLTNIGEVYTCGRGDCGQLGLGPSILFAEHFKMIENLPKYVTAIAAGKVHTAILSHDGNIYAFGDGKYGKLSYETYSNVFEPRSINKFKGYNVLKVVCGGCQTIILAQKKQTENEEDIQNTTNSKIKSRRSLVGIKHCPSKINYTNTNGNSIVTSLRYVEHFQTSTNTNSSLYTKSNSDPDELSVFMNSELMNTTDVKINEDIKHVKTYVIDRTIPIIKIIDDSTISNNHYSSIDQSTFDNTKLNYTSSKNNLKKQQHSDDGASSSDEQSSSISQRNIETSSLNESDIHINAHSIPTKMLTTYYHQETASNQSFNSENWPSSTSSSSLSLSRSTSRISSSISSISDEDQIITSKSFFDYQNGIHLSTIETNSSSHSTKKLIKTESQLGFFSRILSTKSSQKISTTTNKNSRTCLIM
ncbi:unnamed protein product [Rotaria sordida]|uniref:RCC1-like domain-containing protein n=1 Tax=Rotaria sordida TaxID=392033 RepID=A0A814HZ34_9BILA|nr:unnamed protein product [Rotaria sordida]CAF1015909.1 unnamed protein product [Rotaria sordida]